MATNVDTVQIVCKLPHGLILELYDKNGVAQKAPVTIRGGLHPDNVGGSGITTVTKEFADEWFSRNKDLPCVKNGLVYKVIKAVDAQVEAKDRETVKTGLEPIEPEKEMKKLGIEKLDKDADDKAA